MKHLRQILTTLNYFLVKSELISSMEVKFASQKMGGKFYENSIKIYEILKKDWENFKVILH